MGEAVEKRGPSCGVVGTRKMLQPPWTTGSSLLRKLSRISYDPATPCQGPPAKGKRRGRPRSPHAHGDTAQPAGRGHKPGVRRWIRGWRSRCVCTAECRSAGRKEATGLFATTRAGLDGVLRGEKSRTEEDQSSAWNRSYVDTEQSQTHGNRVRKGGGHAWRGGWAGARTMTFHP